MEAKLIKNRLFLRKVVDSYVLHRIKDGILTIEGDSQYTIGGIEPFYKLSLKNCQAIERGYDLDELAIDEIPDSSSTTLQVQRMRFIHGFQKALELLGDKKFTYNQMVSAITESSISHRLPSLIIQDLQQTEWDVEIETTCDGLQTGLCMPEICDCNIIPKLDEKGQLILKIK